MLQTIKTKVMFFLFLLLAVGPSAFAQDASACTAVSDLAGMGKCVEEKVSGLETAVIGVAIAGLVVATVIGAYKMFKGLAKG